MKIVFDYDHVPDDAETTFIIDTVKAANGSCEEICLHVNGKGPSLSFDNELAVATNVIGIDLIKEFIVGVVTEMKTEMGLLHDPKITLGNA